MAGPSSQYDIKDKTAYRAAVTALNTRSRPPAILRFIMQALEHYRQFRKMGWSRPWNKYGIMTFQSFALRFPQDNDLIAMARSVVADQCPDLPGDAAAFLDDLLGDNQESRAQLMGFIFIHEFIEGERRFEGVTLSFGRVCDKRFRDRFDLILEAPLEKESRNDFSRLRVFIDPFRPLNTANAKDPIWTRVIEPAVSESARRLFEKLAAISWDWAEDTSRHWDHWTSAYIDYFGPRQWPVLESNFFLVRDDEGAASASRSLSAP